jgi:hypothetical protein
MPSGLRHGVRFGNVSVALRVENHVFPRRLRIELAGFCIVATPEHRSERGESNIAEQEYDNESEQQLGLQGHAMG